MPVIWPPLGTQLSPGTQGSTKSVSDRLAEVLRRSKKYLGPDGKAMVESLLSPVNLATGSVMKTFDIALRMADPARGGIKESR
jgi:hypothetical protein